MKDSYPFLATLPSDWLVPPEDQPDYHDVPGVVLDEAMSLGAALSDRHVMAGHGDVVALVHHESGQTYTYGDLAAQSDRMAAALAALGVSAGDRIALRGPNRPELVIAAVAAWKIGAVVTPIPGAARPDEIAFYLRDTLPVAVVTASPESEPEYAALEAEAVKIHIDVLGAARPGWVAWEEIMATQAPVPAVTVDLDRVAVVWHTSGTTGRPKGCYHTQRRYLLGGEAFRRAARSGYGQTWCAAAPIGHALGFLAATTFTLQHAATLVMVENFTSPEALLLAITKREVTHFVAIAVTWARLLDVLKEKRASKPSTLRVGFGMWQSSSAAEVFDGWRQRGIVILNNFGSTAFATWIVVPPLEREVPQGALGLPAPGYSVRIIDPATGQDLPEGRIGQLAVRGPTGLTYWRLPERQRQEVRNGWTFQDDLVSRRDGYLHYLGRTDFLISTAGHKVAPGEVEEVLSAHPAVLEVAVLGLPDPIRREQVAAFVVVREPAHAGAALAQELSALVRQRLSAYKCPRSIEFVDALPRNDMGKVQPMQLLERVRAPRRKGR